MKFRIVLELDPVAGGFSAICSELSGSASAGDTKQVIVASHRGRALPLGTMRSIIEGSGILPPEWKR